MSDAIKALPSDQKMTGRQAYEEDVRRKPTYEDGTRRLPWDCLPDYAKATWDYNPTPRKHIRG